MSTMDRDKNDVLSAIELVRIVADTIRDLSEVPSSHLYTQLMNVIDIRCFERVVTLLVDARLVERTPSHLLRWIGPKANPQPNQAS